MHDENGTQGADFIMKNRS